MTLDLEDLEVLRNMQLATAANTQALVAQLNAMKQIQSVMLTMVKQLDALRLRVAILESEKAI